MITKPNVSALLLAGALSSATTSAQAAGTCSGPWVGVEPDAPGVIWGPESRCECSGLRAGVLASNERVGWFWARGNGIASVELEVVDADGAVVGIVATAQVFAGPGQRAGTGFEGVMPLPPGVEAEGWRWNGRYRAKCLGLAQER